MGSLNLIVKWLEIILLILLIATGSVVSSVYISGLIFHSGEPFIHLVKEHWTCLEYMQSKIPTENTCVLYRRSY
jgi:hypothetical protein